VVIDKNSVDWNGEADTAVCPICGSPETALVIPHTQDHITGDAFQIVRCKTCLVAFTFPQPSSFDRFYPDLYRGYTSITKFLLRTLYRLRVRKWLKMFVEPGSVLEVGCGPGFMLDVFRKNGWKVLGTERTVIASKYAREHLGLPVILGGIEQVSDESRFDLVVMFQVLEHMQQPLNTLKECARRLKPGGILLVNVPNFSSWQSEFGGALWVHLDAPRHLFHFTPRSLAGLLEVVGMEVCHVQFTSVAHDPYGWAQTIVNKFTRPFNLLTRYLMGMEKLTIKVVFSLLLCIVLMPASILLALASWVFQKGAVMEVTALRPKMKAMS